MIHGDLSVIISVADGRSDNLLFDRFVTRASTMIQIATKLVIWDRDRLYQIQCSSSKHMNVLEEQPWHRLQLEHMRPSPQIPYLWCFPPHSSPGPFVHSLLPQPSISQPYLQRLTSSTLNLWLKEHPLIWNGLPLTEIMTMAKMATTMVMTLTFTMVYDWLRLPKTRWGV